MTKGIMLLYSGAVALATGGCGNGSAGTIDGFSAAEWAKISTFGPLQGPDADTTNKYADNAAAAAFGHRRR
jgi:hypothetical protein